jgi:uncharacterized protein YggE
METSKNQTNEKTEVTHHSSLVHSKRIHGTLSIVLILLAAFLFAETIKSFKEYRYVGGGIAPSNAITVAGEGEVFAVPDTAEFTFTVIEEAPTAAEVQETATKKANEAVKALVEKGVEEKDIKTINYNLSPKYEWRETTNCLRYPCDRNRVQVGFTLNQSMRVKVNDLDRAGELLELVTSKGVSSVSGLNFTIADEDGLRADARKQAIDEARQKAEKLAEDLGVSLVRIVGFSESGQEGYPMYARFEMMESSEALGLGGGGDVAPTVPAGENKIISNVHITYEIR